MITLDQFNTPRTAYYFRHNARDGIAVTAGNIFRFYVDAFESAPNKTPDLIPY